jgi:DNA-binding PadR family transcriptional regulator
MDRTTLLRAMKPMQRDGLVIAKRGDGDGDPRQMSFSLTAAGRNKLKDAMTCWMSAQQEFEAQVGPSRAARMRSDLLALEVSA